MSERALLERFDLVADHPENIPLLRRYIVDLAVRGKLLEKTALDTSVPEILKRIAAKADLLVKQGKLKKQKPLAPISTDEVPATYLAHCTFERLGNVANLQKGLTGIQSALPGEFPLVVTASARSTCDHYDFDGAAAIVPMVSSTGHGNASLNRLHYQEGKFALGTILCAVFPIDEELVSARFLFEYLMVFKDELLVSKMNGTANVTLTVGKIAEVPVPIIAPAVQRRVDELMALCDQLEAAQNEREAWRDRLVAASLHRIGGAVHPSTSSGRTDIEEAPAPVRAEPVEALTDAVRFHLSHLPHLTTRPQHIKQLRQTILNLAVRGRLVPQDPNDEPAAELLKRIQLEQIRLVKEGKIRKQQPLPLLSSEEIPFEVPDRWEWLRLGNIGFTQTGTTPSSNNPEYFGDYIPFIKPADLTGNITDYSGEGISEEGVEYSRLIPKHSVLMVCIGSSIGKVNVTDRDVCCNQQINTATPCLEHLTAFTSFALKSSYFQKLVLANAGMGTLPIISKGKWEILPIPLPPLAEQHRIVAKVDELMALCDQLEAQFTTTQTDSRRLLEAVLRDALAPALAEAA